VKWQLLATNPADAVEPPRATSPEMQTLTEEEIGQLLATAVTTPSYTAILVAVMTGARRGELLALRWADADLDKGSIEVRLSLQQTNAGLSFKSPKTAKATARSPCPPWWWRLSGAIGSSRWSTVCSWATAPWTATSSSPRWTGRRWTPTASAPRSERSVVAAA